MNEIADQAARKATAESSIDIGRLPAECYAGTDHARLIRGEELAVLLRRERAQLTDANRKSARCATYHDNLRANLQAGRQLQQPDFPKE